MELSGIFGSLVGVSGILILVEFGRIFVLVESGGFLRRGVDISKNLTLVESGGIFRFRF